MPFIYKNNPRILTGPYGASSKKDGVDLVREYAIDQTTFEHLPEPERWKPGQRVQDASPGSIEMGTAIATFINDHYGSGMDRGYAAFYVNGTRENIQVVGEDPSSSGSIISRTIKLDMMENLNFYVIEKG